MFYDKNLQDQIKELYDEFEDIINPLAEHYAHKSLQVEKIIYNDPATIVFFADGTKEIVKCHRDEDFSEEIGVAMAIVNKVFGSRHQFLKEVDRWIEKDEDIQIKNGEKSYARVVDDSYEYVTYFDFFKNHINIKHLKHQYDHLNVLENDCVYEVVYKGCHELYDEMIYVLRDDIGNIFLIGSKGIEVVTQEDI